MNRRESLRVGALGGMLSCGQLLRARGTETGRSAILVFMRGGPSHLDTFDMKPDAPREYRGEFKPIGTNVPGIRICEHLPQTAKLADRFALVRGLSHNLADHGIGTRYVASGNRPLPTIDYPEFGSVVSRRFKVARDMPAFVSIERSLHGPGYLGPQHASLDTGERPRLGRPFNVRGVTLANGLSLTQLERRQDLSADLDGLFSSIESKDPQLTALNEFDRKAYSILSSPRTRKAFDLSLESNAIASRFGPDETGQSLLLSLRLIEAGVRFVTVIVDGWDTHQQNFRELRRRLLPSFDRSFAAFLRTLADKGMNDSTAVLVTGEFGRTPKINGNAGRDHWPRAMFALMAGGKVNAGQVLGASDEKGIGPADGGWTPDDLAASFYENIGIDPRTEFPSRTGRPVTLIRDGKPIPRLVG